MVEIDLPQIEERIHIGRIFLEARPRQRLTFTDVGSHVGHELAARLALLEGTFAIWRVPEQLLDLKVQRRGAQLVRIEVVGRCRAQGERHRRGFLIEADVVEPLGFVHGRGLCRQRTRKEVNDRRGGGREESLRRRTNVCT
jgi:hypothetical protein